MVEPGDHIMAKFPGYVRPDYTKDKDRKLKIWIPANPSLAFKINFKDLDLVTDKDKKAKAKGQPTMKVLNARQVQE